MTAADRRCRNCQTLTSAPWRAWCDACWELLDVGDDAGPIGGAWQHPVYGYVSERVAVVDVLDRMTDRIAQGKPPNITKAAAVALLDHLRPLEHVPDVDEPTPGER